jgi:hypothetical protein
MAGTVYTIDFTDPSLSGKSSFQISPGAFDGPELNATDPTKCHTSLHLFGMGFLRYGEKANENFIKLLENFASSTAPLKPTVGQLWFDTSTNTLKVFNGSLSWTAAGGVLPPQTFVIVGASSTKFFVAGDISTQLTPGGQFVVVGGSNAGPYTINSAPGSVIYNGTTNQTEVLVTTLIPAPISGGTIYVSPQPTGPVPGQLWFNIVDGQLYVWDGSNWTHLFSGNSSGNIDMKTMYRIFNLPNPTDNTDATNKQYVDTKIATELAALGIGGTTTNLQTQIDGKVSKVGDLMTGTLTIKGNSSYLVLQGGTGAESMRLGGSGSIATEPDIQITAAALLTADDTFNIHFDSNDSGTGYFVVSKGTTAVNGSEVQLMKVSVTGEITAETANYETLVTHNKTLTNKKYVDDAITTAVGGATSIPAINPTVPKVGDIRIVGSVISIYAAGAWKQVFPAVYS